LPLPSLTQTLCFPSDFLTNSIIGYNRKHQNDLASP